MSGLFTNPEFVRYTRSQLRRNKLLSTALIALLLSFAIGFYFVRDKSMSGGRLEVAGFDLLRLSFWLQALILAGGGGIACLNSIYSEKQQNTFDYQRITRLTPLELAMGKLFGPPLLMYFVCLCLVPLTLYSVVIAHADPLHVLAAYVVLLVASITYHSFTLLLSMLAIRGSQVSSIILALIVLWIGSVDGFAGSFSIHSLGPFWARELAVTRSWQARMFDTTSNTFDGWSWSYTDLLWRHPVHHFPVLVVIDLILIFWFVLAVARNIKKDPDSYELYSPVQFLCLAVFLNVLIASFFNMALDTSLDRQAVFLSFDIVIFALLGLALLRSRERMRIMVRGSERFWRATSWPAPLLALAAVIGGLLIAGCLYYVHYSKSWSFSFAVFRSLFFVLWIVRDIQFLQYMNLRPAKHPLVMAFLYLSIYYVCAIFFLSALGCFRLPERIPFTSVFLPTPIFLLDAKSWLQSPGAWIAGVLVHVVLLAFLFYLQSLRVRQLEARPATAQ